MADEDGATQVERDQEQPAISVEAEVAIQLRLRELQANREELLAQVNAHNGAIQELERLLSAVSVGLAILELKRREGNES